MTAVGIGIFEHENLATMQRNSGRRPRPFRLEDNRRLAIGGDLHDRMASRSRGIHLPQLVHRKSSYKRQFHVRVMIGVIDITIFWLQRINYSREGAVGSHPKNRI